MRQILDKNGYDISIAVDGEVDIKTAPLAVNAGASVLVAGSSLYNSKASLSKNLELLYKSIER